MCSGKLNDACRHVAIKTSAVCSLLVYRTIEELKFLKRYSGIAARKRLKFELGCNPRYQY